MNSILLAANDAFTASLGEFMLDPDLVDLISGGRETKCQATECGALTVESCGDQCTSYKADCVACE